MSYPSLEDVEIADRVQLGRWWRFLPSPGLEHVGKDDFSKHHIAEVAIMDRIVDRFNEMGGWTAEISKTVGLGL